MKKSGFIFALCFFQMLLFGFAFAQDTGEKSTELGEVVVTATGYETSAKETGRSIDVITEEQIKQSGKKSVYELLNTVPGVTITGYGNYGSVVNVYIRGSRKSNALILIDGVRLTDPTGLQKQVDLSKITSDNIEKIEVIRGAMSSKYGSEATGGVINIITKKGKGKASVTVGLEAGSLGYYKGYISTSGSTERMNYSFNITSLSTNGDSAVRDTSSSAYDFDDDGYENLTASGAVNVKVSENAALDMTMRYIDARSEYDDGDPWGSGTMEDDPNLYNLTEYFAGGVVFRHSPLDWLMYQGGVTYSSISRSEVDSNDTIDATNDNSLYDYHGKNVGANFLVSISMADINEFTAGVDYSKETGTTASAYYDAWTAFDDVYSITDEISIYNYALYAHDKLSLMKRIFINAGARIEKNEEFGTHSTFDGALSFIVPVTETNLRASAGTGFRAPTIYELYDDSYGNEDLDPETSLTWDLGIEQSIFNKMITFGIAYFAQEIEDEIVFGTAYENSDEEVKSKGYEVFVKVAPVDFLSATYNYTYVDYDVEDGADPVSQRPRHKHNLAVNAVVMKKVNINLSYMYQTKTYSYGYPSYYELGSFHKVDLNVRYNAMENLSAYVRVENLLNEDYEISYGYNTPERTFFAGVDLKI